MDVPIQLVYNFKWLLVITTVNNCVQKCNRGGRKYNKYYNNLVSEHHLVDNYCNISKLRHHSLFYFDINCNVKIVYHIIQLIFIGCDTG